MNYTTLLLEKKDGFAIITINRPDKLNALNAACKQELKELLASLRTDSDIRCLVITGAGEKAFVAGTDIAELKGLDASSGTAFARGGQAVFEMIQHLGKPVIAAVNGYALGGGCELALACHIRIASESAKFGQPEVSLGIIPGYGGTQRLPRLVGAGKAMEMILTGNHIDAREAHRIGLVNSVVPQGELLLAAEALARTIAQKGPVAVGLAMRAVNAAEQMPLNEGLAFEAATFGECSATQDADEGIGAFLEKRKPAFKGK